MGEAELESLIGEGNNDARFVLGKLLVDNTSHLINRNIVKGMNWVKEAVKKGSIEALEYKTYLDIKFGETPDIDDIMSDLNKVIATNKSTNASNTLAEFYHA